MYLKGIPDKYVAYLYAIFTLFYLRIRFVLPLRERFSGIIIRQGIEFVKHVNWSQENYFKEQKKNAFVIS